MEYHSMYIFLHFFELISLLQNARKHGENQIEFFVLVFPAVKFYFVQFSYNSIYIDIGQEV